MGWFGVCQTPKLQERAIFLLINLVCGSSLSITIKNAILIQGTPFWKSTTHLHAFCATILSISVRRNVGFFTNGSEG